MTTLWKGIGFVLAKLAHGALVAAKWSSTHPVVLQEINAAITAVNPAAGAIATASGSLVNGVIAARRV
jgi:hypothetical protein